MVRSTNQKIPAPVFASEPATRAAIMELPDLHTGIERQERDDYEPRFGNTQLGRTDANPNRERPRLPLDAAVALLVP